MTQGRKIFKELPTIQCRMASIGDLSTVSLGQHPGIGSGVSPKRASEFKAGRALAVELLKSFGYSNVIIGVDKDRCPVWPDRLVGSISHSDTIIVVAIAAKNDHLAIGIDVEPIAAVSNEIVSSILTDREVANARLADCKDFATIAFVCKEAFYKAVFPTQRESIGFHDVQVLLDEDSFRIQCNSRSRSSFLADQGIGSVEYHEDHVIAVYRVPATGKSNTKVGNSSHFEMSI